MSVKVSGAAVPRRPGPGRRATSGTPARSQHPDRQRGDARNRRSHLCPAHSEVSCREGAHTGVHLRWFTCVAPRAPRSSSAEHDRRARGDPTSCVSMAKRQHVAPGSQRPLGRDQQFGSAAVDDAHPGREVAGATRDRYLPSRRLELDRSRDELPGAPLDRAPLAGDLPDHRLAFDQLELPGRSLRAGRTLRARRAGRTLGARRAGRAGRAGGATTGACGVMSTLGVVVVASP